MLATKRNKVFVDNPPIKSRASLLLLKEQLGEEERSEWIEFRNEFFDENEPLICHYCKKTNLKREIVDHTDRSQLDILATIDHVVALANGGARYDKKNCVVSCFPCNNNKKDRDY
jgi:5-methylcytosine-specific restriction endonuclease McrA